MLDDELVWTDPVVTSRRTLSPGLYDSPDGSLRCGLGGAAASTDQRGASAPGLCLGGLCAIRHSGHPTGVGQWGDRQSTGGMGLGPGG